MTLNSAFLHSKLPQLILPLFKLPSKDTAWHNLTSGPGGRGACCWWDWEETPPARRPRCGLNREVQDHTLSQSGSSLLPISVELERPERPAALGKF